MNRPRDESAEIQGAAATAQVDAEMANKKDKLFSRRTKILAGTFVGISTILVPGSALLTLSAVVAKIVAGTWVASGVTTMISAIVDIEKDHIEYKRNSSPGQAGSSRRGRP